MPTVPFTAEQVASIRYYAGYTDIGGFGYVLSPGMALLDTQLANMGDAMQALVVSTFLDVLPGLDSAIDSMTGTLGVATAAVFTRNPDEQDERERQFRKKRLRMCAVIGCDPGIGITGGDMMGQYTAIPT